MFRIIKCPTAAEPLSATPCLDRHPELGLVELSEREKRLLGFLAGDDVEIELALADLPPATIDWLRAYGLVELVGERLNWSEEGWSIIRQYGKVGQPQVGFAEAVISLTKSLR